MKKNIGAVNVLYPLPIVIIGTEVEGKPNYITIAHVGIIDYVWFREANEIQCKSSLTPHVPVNFRPCSRRWAKVCRNITKVKAFFHLRSLRLCFPDISSYS